MVKPLLSFIVSAYDRPYHLDACIASLVAQTCAAIEVIVTDNQPDESLARKNREVTLKRFGVKYINPKMPGCYHSAEQGAKYAEGEYLVFASEDSLYMPTFAEEMWRAAVKNDWSLVYCDALYSWKGSKYSVLNTEPRLNKIDKTSFILRRSSFYGFPDKVADSPCAADGMLIERLVSEGIKHGKVNDCLVVHS